MNSLPAGQRARDTLPRFGLLPFAARFPHDPARRRLAIAGAVAQPIDIDADHLEALRTEQTSDLHCVTTWSVQGLRWSGFAVEALFERHIADRARPDPTATWVLLRGQDGYRSAMSLADLLRPGVLLADRLNGEPLSIAHGAPWRLVAPAHYGYKSVKHLARIDFVHAMPNLYPFGFRFLNHPRGRVEFEERGRGLPGWLFRWLYRPFVPYTAARFEQALRARRSAPTSPMP